MPIRTHRGRAAVYRTLWGWPLRSPRHLVAALLGIALLAAGTAIALPDDPATPTGAATESSEPPNQFDPQSRAQLPGADPAESDPAGPGPSGSSTSRRPVPVGQAPDAALTVADAWVRAFLTAPDGIGAADWSEQLRPYTTEETFPELQSVDPANVPEAQVIGQPRTISTADGSAEVDVPTSAVVVRLLLVSTPAGWQVAGYQQVG